MLTRVPYSQTNGELITRITGQPTASEAGLRVALLSTRPVHVLARRLLIGTGIAVDRAGDARMRTRRGHRKIIRRPRVFLIRRGHPWRTTDPA